MYRKKISKKDLERLQRLRLMDDDFMTICFDNYIEGAELLLKIILDRDDLKVSEVKTQKELKNIQGRSVRLDIHATDKQGNKYDIEIQRADKGANKERARYHSALLDSSMLNPNDDFTGLRENYVYVIFITENDVLGMNEPIYHIERTVLEHNVQFNDGEHIIYVNGSIRTDDSALGKLMSDFYCTKADGMYYKELSDKVRHYKESEEGVKTMCDIWEEVKNEGIQEGKIEGKIEGKLEASIENAKTMLRLGKLSLEEIAVCSGLSIEKVRELAGNKSA